MKVIAKSERNAREDHLWGLREDPGYFAEILQEESEHRREMVRDIRGQEHPSLRKPGRQLFWKRVTEDVLVDSYFGFAIFDEIVRRIDDFASQHAKHHDRMKAEGASVPEDLSMAFQKLCILLSNMAAELIRHLLTGLYPSPPLRRFCVREPHGIQATTYRMPQRNQSHKRVMALFDVLFDARKLHLFGLHTLTGEIGRLMQTDSGVGALFSPWIANRLSSLTVVSECLHQLHLYKPWSWKLENDAALNRIMLERIDREVLKQWTPILKAKFDRSQIYNYAVPTDGKFFYPIHRRRNKQNVQILRKAEANLDELWRIVDRHYKSNAEGKSQHDLIAHLLRKDRVIQRTPEWSRPENTRAPAEKEDYEYRPFSTLFDDVTKQVTGTFDHATHFQETPKAKTWGNTTRDISPQLNITHEFNDESRSVNVDRRAYRVFQALFHSPNNADTPGEISWVNFLNAMVSVGFTAQKLHGSAWNFTPKIVDGGLHRGIQFHEPHPSSKIPFQWARRFGRRLTRAYEWNSAVFGLA